jgi:hypothetical protein
VSLPRPLQESEPTATGLVDPAQLTHGESRAKIKAKKAGATWHVGEKVEARDIKGHWYRSTVIAVSFTGRQVRC